MRFVSAPQASSLAVSRLPDRSQAVIEYIDGGVTAPAGFRAGAAACGIKKRRANAEAPLDLAIVAADRPVAAAAVFTVNKAVAAPVVISREHLERSGGLVKAIVVNS